MWTFLAFSSKFVTKFSIKSSTKLKKKDCLIPSTLIIDLNFREVSQCLELGIHLVVDFPWVDLLELVVDNLLAPTPLPCFGL